MERLPWKKIMTGCIILAILVVARAIVSMGRAYYWRQDILGSIRSDPWIYVGLAAIAVGVFAWTMLPGKESEPPHEPEPPAETE